MKPGLTDPNASKPDFSFSVFPQGIGDDQDVESSSANLVETDEGFQPVFFYPRRLKNLVPIDDIESLMPIMDFKVANFYDEETPQIYALCGRGNRSSLRILRPGLAVTEMAVSPLPGTPRAVWTVKKSVTDDFDSYIIVSFVNATLVLSIGETVEEVSDSGFLGTTPSLSASLLGDDSLMQVRARFVQTGFRSSRWLREASNKDLYAHVLFADMLSFFHVAQL